MAHLPRTQHWKGYARASVFLAVLSAVNLLLLSHLGYRATGFIFLVGVLPLAVVDGIGPALFFAVASALTWDYFFISPQFRFSIQTAEDALMNVTYLAVAVVSGLLGSRLKAHEELLRQRERVAERNQILEKSETLHQTLLNSVSHELRTPLTSILGNLDYVERFVALEQTAPLAEVRRAAERLNQTVTNLLDMSRVTSGALQLNREVVDLHDFLHSCVSASQNLLKDHEVRIVESSEPILVRVDEKLLETAVVNLLSNAVRHSPKGTWITLSGQKAGTFATILVHDQGPGIPDPQRESVFDLFYTSPGAGGVGLGLSIVRAISVAHGGQARAVEMGLEIAIPLEPVPEEVSRRFELT